MAGQDGDLVGLAEAMHGLTQAVGGIATEQRQQGQMLRVLLELAAAKPETRLDELILALIGRLDAHAGMVAHVESEFKTVATTIADAIGKYSNNNKS